MSNTVWQSLTAVVAIAPTAIIAVGRIAEPEQRVIAGIAAANGNNAGNDYDGGKQDVPDELHVRHPVIGSGKKS